MTIKTNKPEPDHLSSCIRNELFQNKKGFDLGKPRWVFSVWYLLKCFFFLSAFPWP